ncbi:MAG: 5-formyltetrahydrofolate cyclo-ligase [Polyangiaceae bacterium]|nr:5-formyltetrahydrofolate cyclo-ligase [Polyangiaceae bacterium]
MSHRPPSLGHGGLPPPEFDPAELASLRVEAKRVVRRRLRAVRGALPAAAVAARSHAACVRLSALPAIAAARRVALYAAVGAWHELDLSLLDLTLRARGVALFYPFMERRGAELSTGFRLTRSPEDLAVRGHCFPEPPRDAPEALPGTLDAIVVAALGAAPDGHRLGHGAGWYDLALPQHCPPAVAIAAVFDFQILIEVPAEPHDARCAWVVTDARTIDVCG